MEHSLLSRTWLVHLCVYAYLCVCVLTREHTHTCVCGGQRKSQVSSSGMSSPHFETESLLELELTS